MVSSHDVFIKVTHIVAKLLTVKSFCCSKLHLIDEAFLECRIKRALSPLYL